MAASICARSAHDPGSSGSDGLGLGVLQGLARLHSRALRCLGSLGFGLHRVLGFEVWSKDFGGWGFTVLRRGVE